MTDTDWIDRQEYPFTSRYLEVPAGRLHYVDAGNGPPVVMIHGNPTWSFLYRHLIKQLQKTHRCVAMDHIGFGLSDKPTEWSYLPGEHAANLTALIEKLELKEITLVVQDWGGPIGLSYAVARPDNIAGIVILNTWAWPVNRDPYYIAFSSLVGGPIGRMLIRRYNLFARVIMPKAFGDRDRLSAAAHEHYLRPLATPKDRTGCAIFPREITGSTAWLDQLWSGVQKLKDTPVLIVWGMKDIAFREKELNRWESAFPRARSVRFDSVGHFVQEEAPEELTKAVVPFLSA
jgi:haloalkane dehalogenase